MPQTTQATCALCHNNRHSLYAEGLCQYCYNETVYRDARSFSGNSTYNRTTRRRFGVEIETHSCRGFRRLLNEGVFGWKSDCTVDGLEFFSPILYGDRGLDAIRDFCRVARELEWSVNRSCGLHVHLEMRNESAAQLRAIAKAYMASEDAWFTLVSRSRRRNRFAQRARDIYDFEGLVLNPTGRSHDQICEFGYWANRYGRYYWLNLSALRRFNTFEIRLHQGSLNYHKINNWIRAHMYFVEAVRDMSDEDISNRFGSTVETQWAGVKRCIGNRNVVRYMSRRRTELR